ncbi:glycosyl hydrolase family 71-domain-containing protein [Mycena rebaudengoi]|nr:glycosyl hydrolase family 71-domain-containing protein [Mycena rebaudengoi]
MTSSYSTSFGYLSCRCLLNSETGSRGSSSSSSGLAALQPLHTRHLTMPSKTLTMISKTVRGASVEIILIRHSKYLSSQLPLSPSRNALILRCAYFTLPISIGDSITAIRSFNGVHAVLCDGAAKLTLLVSILQVGDVQTYVQSDWEADMNLAKSIGIDGSALSLDESGKIPPSIEQLGFAYAAAANVFINLDFAYWGGGDISPMATYIQTYATQPGQFMYNGAAFVSNFVGDGFAYRSLESSSGIKLFACPNWQPGSLMNNANADCGLSWSVTVTPRRGHPPYTSSTGNIHSAGHSQSPIGSLGRISTRPNLMLTLRLVLTLALITGGRIFPSVALETPEHAAR